MTFGACSPDCYRGHDYDGEAKVMLSGNKRGLSPTMKRGLKLHPAI